MSAEQTQRGSPGRALGMPMSTPRGRSAMVIPRSVPACAALAEAAAADRAEWVKSPPPGPERQGALAKGTSPGPERQGAWLAAARCGAHLWLVLALSACGQTGYRDVGEGPKLPVAESYARGVILFVGPEARALYESHAEELLGQAFPNGIGIATPAATPTVAGAPMLSAAAGRLVPQSLTLTPNDETNALQISVGFLPLAMAIETSTEGCQVSVTLAVPELRGTLLSSRDLVGHIRLHATRESDEALVLPEAHTSPGCGALSEAAQGALESAAATLVWDGVVSALAQGSPSVQSIEALGESLLGTESPSYLAWRPSDTPTDGALDLVLTPNSTDGLDAAIQFATGTAVLPLRLGLRSIPHPCVANLPLEVGKPGVVAPPNPNLEGWDIGVAVRRDALSAALSHFTRAGGLCGWARRRFGVPITLATLEHHLPEPVLTALRGSELSRAPASVRIRPLGVPQLSFGPDGAAVIALGPLSVEVYLHYAGAEWGIYTTQVKATLQGDLTLRTIGGAQVVTLEGSPVVAEGSSAEDSALARMGLESMFGALDAASGQPPGAVTLPLIALKRALPYPLGVVHFEVSDHHLLILGRLDTSHAPTLSRIEVPLSALPTAPPAASASCRASPSGGSPSAALWLLFGGVFGALVYRRRVRARETGLREL